MRLNEHHKEIAGVLALYGIRPDIEPTNGGHVRFKWKAGHLDQSLLTSKTPSDWRTRRNAVSRVRRMLKKAGITKINPCPVIEGLRARRIATPTGTLEARVAQLESDVAMLLDIITGPKPDEAPAPAEPKKRGRHVVGWIFRAMRYDDFLSVNDIAKAAGRPLNVTASTLTYWKGKGFVEHKPRVGWRKKPNVETLDTAPVINGHANGNGAAH